MSDLIPHGTTGFGSVQHVQTIDTVAHASANREMATIQAMFVMAMQRPRSTDQFRAELLKEANRPGFAEVAVYRKPVGKDKEGKMQYAEGPSARFMETAAQCFRHVRCTVAMIEDTPTVRIFRACAYDLQNGVYYESEYGVDKFMLRRGYQDRSGEWHPPSGRDVVSSRQNSAGEMTYLVSMTPDEISLEARRQGSIHLRNVTGRLLPRDIVDEAISKCRATKAAADKADPDAAKRKLIDAFAGHNVMPADLQMFLGHSLDRLSGDELQTLREMFTALKEGDSWESLMNAAQPAGTEEAAAEVAKRKLKGLKTEPKTAPQSSADAAAEAREGDPSNGGSSQPAPAPETPEQEADRLTREAIAREQAEAAPPPAKKTFTMGGRK